VTALADIPATLTIDNALDEALVIATSIRLAPLAVGTVIQMAGRGSGDKSDIYQALFIAEQMGHIEAGGLSPLEDPVPSGHTLFGGQDPIGDVEPEGRAGVLGIHIGAPTVGRPVLRGVTALTPLGVATGAPTVGAPALLGIADLTPLGIATGAPTVGAPVLRGVTALTPLGIATGAPTVGSPALHGAATLTPLGIATGAPTVGSPVLEDVPAGPSRWARFNTMSDFPLVPADAGAVTVYGYRLRFKARINPYSSTLIITGSVNLVNLALQSGGIEDKASILTISIMQMFVPPDNVAVAYIQLQCPLSEYPWSATRESYVVLTNDGQWHDYEIAISVDGELPGIPITYEDMPAGVMDTAFLSGDDLSSFVAVLSSAAPVDVADVVHIPTGSGHVLELRGIYKFDETSGTVAHDSSGSFVPNDISGVNADIWTPT
jgi:hypothetical protein